MKTLKVSTLLLFLALILDACSTVGARTEEKALFEISPALPLVIYEHCLFNLGVTPEELQQGKIKGTFQLQMDSPDARLQVLNIKITQSDDKPSQVFEACVDSAKETFSHIGSRIGIEAAVENSYTYTGDLFPVGLVNISHDKQFLKTVRMEIGLEKASKPNSRAYRVKFYQPSPQQITDEQGIPPLSTMVSDGTILEMENKH